MRSSLGCVCFCLLYNFILIYINMMMIVKQHFRFSIGRDNTALRKMKDPKFVSLKKNSY